MEVVEADHQEDAVDLMLPLYDVRPFLLGAQDVGLRVDNLLVLVVLVDPDKVDLEELDGDENADLAQASLVGYCSLQDEFQEGVFEPVEEVAMLEIDHHDLLSNQFLHVDSIRQIEPTDLLNQPISFGQLPSVPNLMYLIHLQRLHYNLWELVINNIILVGLVAAIQHRQHAI